MFAEIILQFAGKIAETLRRIGIDEAGFPRDFLGSSSIRSGRRRNTLRRAARPDPAHPRRNVAHSRGFRQSTTRGPPGAVNAPRSSMPSGVQNAIDLAVEGCIKIVSASDHARGVSTIKTRDIRGAQRYEYGGGPDKWHPQGI
jgi:hypothetical protein